MATRDGDNTRVPISAKATPGFDALFERVYEDLRALATSRMQQQRASHTLTPTALVNEVYLKLKASNEAPDERLRLLGLSARAMRQILIDHARSKKRDRRGGGWRRVSFSDLAIGEESREYDVAALGEALEELERLSERKARLVELRCFAGLTNEEAAMVLAVARSTVANDWRFVRAWLRSRLVEENADER